MIVEKSIFWDYSVFDEDGFLSGIKKNAPDDAKKAYEDFMKEQTQFKEKNV